MKFSKYTNIVEFDGGILVHNSLYNSSMKVYKKDKIDYLKEISDNVSFEFDESNKFHVDLKKLHFILDNDIDESRTVNYFYDQRFRQAHLFLIVTRACNFRCPYCYQPHNVESMSPETYDIARKFAVNLATKQPYGDFIVNFFGGEPLLEYKNIVNFMTLLNKDIEGIEFLNGRKFVGQITTNGYLLNKNNFTNLVNSGVTSYQITVDGLANTHNKGRYLASGEGSWKTIIDNLFDAKKSDLDFTIQIRTNYTKEILDNFDEYLDFISLLVKDDKRFTLYFEAVKDHGTIALEDGIEIVDEKEYASKIVKMIMEKGLSKNYVRQNEYFHQPFGIACYAANELCFVFDVDNKIKKCSFDQDNEEFFVGKIEDEKVEIDYDLLANWTSYEPKEYCKKCKVFPICYQRKCPPVDNYPECSELYYKLYVESLKASYLS